MLLLKLLLPVLLPGGVDVVYFSDLVVERFFCCGFLLLEVAVPLGEYVVLGIDFDSGFPGKRSDVVIQFVQCTGDHAAASLNKEVPVSVKGFPGTYSVFSVQHGPDQRIGVVCHGSFTGNSGFGAGKICHYSLAGSTDYGFCDVCRLLQPALIFPGISRFSRRSCRLCFRLPFPKPFFFLGFAQSGRGAFG